MGETKSPHSLWIQPPEIFERGMNRNTISASNTEKLYQHLYNTTNWRNFEYSFDSFYKMSQHSAKMEKIAKHYKKLYELSKNHLESFEF